MIKLTAKQLRLAGLFALIVYCAVMVGVVTWLTLRGEETIQQRLAASPSATVTLSGEEPEIPSSWQAPSAEAPAEIAVTDAAEPAQDQPEEAPADQDAAPDKAPQETKPPEGSSADKAAPAASATVEPPVVETPAVVVDPTATPRAAWHRYARPFDQKDTRPRIGLIIADLGLAATATQAAIQQLPGDVTLAFSSLAPDLEQWLGSARAAGHETILTIPMEPENYPQNDAGPNSLLLGLSDEVNIDRLKRALARAEGYVAVTPYMGEKFVTSDKKLLPVLQAIKAHEVLVLDGTMNKASLIAPLSRYAGLPFVRSDLVIDAAASSQAIDAQLQALEETARSQGQAVGVALPYPVTFEKLKAWIATLEKKGLVLAPLTALASQEVPTP